MSAAERARIAKLRSFAPGAVAYVWVVTKMPDSSGNCLAPHAPCWMLARIIGWSDDGLFRIGLYPHLAQVSYLAPPPMSPSDLGEPSRPPPEST